MVVMACYAPHPQAGGPCATGGTCPTPLVCSPATGTCELTSVDSSVIIDVPVDLPPGCAPEICGDGVDQDCSGSDALCPGNDGPSGAVDVTAGGTFPGDASAATDDVEPFGCGAAGGRDVFYTVTLAAPQVYYFDTFGSSFDTVIRVFDKACGNVGTGANATACVDDACGGGKSQLAVSLPAGTSCIVVDQQSSAVIGGAIMLRVIRGGRDGRPLASGISSNTGDTCPLTNVTEPVDVNCDGPGSGGRDDALFFTLCPSQTLTLDADTCNATTSYDSVLYVKRVTGQQVGCNDDTCGTQSRITNVPISNASLFWLYVDGYDPSDCGPYQVDTNLR
jgi:hypothetical protein